MPVAKKEKSHDLIVADINDNEFSIVKPFRNGPMAVQVNGIHKALTLVPFDPTNKQQLFSYNATSKKIISLSSSSTKTNENFYVEPVTRNGKVKHLVFFGKPRNSKTSLPLSNVRFQISGSNKSTMTTSSVLIKADYSMKHKQDILNYDNEQEITIDHFLYTRWSLSLKTEIKRTKSALSMTPKKPRNNNTITNDLDYKKRVKFSNKDQIKEYIRDADWEEDESDQTKHSVVVATTKIVDPIAVSTLAKFTVKQLQIRCKRAGKTFHDKIKPLKAVWIERVLNLTNGSESSLLTTLVPVIKGLKQQQHDAVSDDSIINNARIQLKQIESNRHQQEMNQMTIQQLKSLLTSNDILFPSTRDPKQFYINLVQKHHLMS